MHDSLSKRLNQFGEQGKSSTEQDVISSNAAGADTSTADHHGSQKAFATVPAAHNGLAELSRASEPGAVQSKHSTVQVQSNAAQPVLADLIAGHLLDMANSLDNMEHASSHIQQTWLKAAASIMSSPACLDLRAHGGLYAVDLAAYERQLRQLHSKLNSLTQRLEQVADYAPGRSTQNTEVHNADDHARYPSA